MCKNRKGFSLLELLIVVSVVATLGAVGVGFYLNYSKNIEIKTVANTLISDLKQVQSKSMTGAGGFKWGVHLVNGEKDYYETFSSPSDYSNASKKIISTIYLPQGVSFSNPTSGATKDIIFNKITGGTIGNSITLSSSDTTKTISVSSVGSIINGEFVISGAAIKLLVVAGGGGGGADRAGAGGGGGVIYKPAYNISSKSYAVTVGGGGSGTAPNIVGGKGQNSIFDSLIAIGGGGGGNGKGDPGAEGGSGGGGGNANGFTPCAGGSGTEGQGNNGGLGVYVGPHYGGGGGGGAGGVGEDGTSESSGDGGVGLSFSITGSPVFYGGGGGAGSYNSGVQGVGGNGGGGNGGTTSSSAGVENTGGGGGSSGMVTSAGSNGGSGIVIISYLTDSGVTATGGVKTVVGAETIHTFTTSGSFVVQSITSGETPAPTVAVGDIYQGGVVAYILQAGDSGYNANVQHGLISAVNDQSTGIVFSVLNTINAGTASGVGIGTGNANTIAIVSAYGTENNAAKLCSDLNLGGKTDWYLPSKDELNKLYLNKTQVGNFSSANYWTSTERSDWPEPYAYIQNMGSGSQSQNGDKQNNNYVRCTRSF